MATRRRYFQTLTAVFVALLFFYKFIYFSSPLNWNTGGIATLYAFSKGSHLHLVNLSSTATLNSHINYLGYACINTSTIPQFKICPYSPDRDVYISAALVTDGLWEPFMTKVFQEALDKAPDATVVDIGANIGYYSMLAGAVGHRVIAVEPNEESVRHLVAATILNNYHDRITLVSNAISNKIENVALSIEESNQGAVHVIGSHQFWKHENQGPTVKAVTLDNLVGLTGTTDVLLKLDIEGYECKALESAGAFLDTLNVNYIFMEWKRLSSQQHKHATPCPARALKKMTANLVSRGYIPYELRYGIPLGVLDTNSWKAGDIYWRHKDVPALTPAITSSSQTP